jgi:hypothetical protein
MRGWTLVGIFYERKVRVTCWLVYRRVYALCVAAFHCS